MLTLDCKWADCVMTNEAGHPKDWILKLEGISLRLKQIKAGKEKSKMDMKSKIFYGLPKCFEAVMTAEKNNLSW